MSAARVVNQSMSEPTLQREVEKLLSARGWLFFHRTQMADYVLRQDTRPAARRALAVGKGFYDLFAIRPPYILLIELKSEKGRLTREQQTWKHYGEQAAGANQHVSYFLWRPSHLRDGEIDRILW